MNKIIKIADGKVFVGKDDGSILETEISNASGMLRLVMRLKFFLVVIRLF